MEKTPRSSTGKDIVGEDRAVETYFVRGKPVNPKLVLLSLSFGLFMSLLDTTIVNVALTDIQTRLHADLLTAGWVVAAYNLTFAVLLVIVGRLADQYGRKRMFLIGMILFSVGSLLCALAPSIGWLIGFRVLQAAGGAALNPISLAIIIAVFPSDKRGAATGIWGALIGFSSACGPVLGGFLTQTFTWRSIFFVNVPFCVLGLIMVTYFVPETHDPNQTRRIDLVGTLLLSLAILCLVLGFTKGDEWGWLSVPLLSLFAAALIGLILFVLVEAKQAAPIIDLKLFSIPSFCISDITMLLFNISWQGPLLILTLYFQRYQNDSNVMVGYGLLPVSLAVILASLLMGRFEQKINFTITAVIGAFLYTLGLGLYQTLPVSATIWDTVWRNIIVGAGAGMIYQSLPNINLSSIPQAKLGVASGVYNTCRQVGLTLSAALLLSILYNLLSNHVGAQGIEAHLQMLYAFKGTWLCATAVAFLAWLSTLALYAMNKR